jgi:hypothetical protein
MLSRRKLLRCACACAALSSFPSVAHARLRGGCFLAHDPRGNEGSTSRETGQGDRYLSPRTGNKEFDFAIAQTLSNLSDLFGVLPEFGFYEEAGSSNAIAMRDNLSDNNRYNGTVLFGKKLLVELMNKTEGPETSFAAVCAHEYGHILQYKYNIDDYLLQGETSVKKLELHADFLAGYYAGAKKLKRIDFKAAVFAVTQNENGDNNFYSKTHHGTPDERGNAVRAGYKASYHDRMSLNDALKYGIHYVTSL